MVDDLVYALNTDSYILEIINSKANDDRLIKIQTVQGNTDTIPLEDASIDIVVSLVLHEVKPLAKTLQQINQVLKEGGYFVCVEIEKVGNSTNGPLRISSTTMEQELISAGFSITEKLIPSDHIYIFITEK